MKLLERKLTLEINEYFIDLEVSNQNSIETKQLINQKMRKSKLLSKLSHQIDEILTSQN